MDNLEHLPDPFYDIFDPKIQNWAPKVPKLAQRMAGVARSANNF